MGIEYANDRHSQLDSFANRYWRGLRKLLDFGDRNHQQCWSRILLGSLSDRVHDRNCRLPHPRRGNWRPILAVSGTDLRARLQ
jgi:hypothetical protein